MKTALLIVLLCVSCAAEDAKPFGGSIVAADAGGGDAATGGRRTSTGGAPGTGGALATGGSSTGGAPGTGGAPATGGSSTGGATATGGAGGALVAPCPADAPGFAFNAACAGYARCHAACDLAGQRVAGCAGGPTGRSCVDSCQECGQ